jgi:RNA polymerase sigma factor (sigma-70 family)
MEPEMQGKEADHQSERELIAAAMNGSRASIEALLRKQQDWIYNLCRRMVMNPEDSADLTQEILLKIAVNLSRYDERIASFTTWTKKIAVNHVLSSRKRKMEEIVTTLDAYGRDLDSIPDRIPDARVENDPSWPLLVEETMIGCLAGMILCLSREERIVYVIGEIMGMTDVEAADVLQISREAYRQRLSRARRSLYSFMNDKCGLINSSNPCRCAKKTISFIEYGWVDPKSLKFAAPHRKKVLAYAGENYSELDDFCDAGYSKLARNSPWWGTPQETLERILGFLDQKESVWQD